MSAWKWEWKFESKSSIRAFIDAKDEDLVWHRDKEDRKVFVIFANEGWELQLDDQEPVTLIEGAIHRIPKMVYHRLINNGDGRLFVRVDRL